MRDAIFNGYPVHLVETVEEIHSLKEKFTPKVMCGVDCETKGLEFKPEQVVGVCLSGGSDYSVKGYAGYYLPIRHNGYNNLPIKDVMELTQWVIDNRQTVFHNRNFDASMIEYDGIKIPFVGGMHDSQIMCYLVFNEPYPALKDYCKRFLKWDMIEFSENKAEDHNFGTTDPTVSFKYACFTPDTKFLTECGFKTFDEVGNLKVAQWNPKTNKIEFVKPLRKIDTFSERVLSCESSRVNFSVSPEHRIVRAFGRTNKWMVQRADEVFGKKIKIPTGTGGVEGKEITDNFVFPATEYKCGRNHSTSRVDGGTLSINPDAFIEMVGFMLADGSCSERGTSREIRLCQANIKEKQRQIEWLRNLNVRLGMLFTETEESRVRDGHSGTMIDFCRTHKSLISFIKGHFYKDGRKTIPRWIFKTSIRQRKLFLNAYFLADGSKQSSRNCYHIDVCNNKELAELLLELVVSVGYTCKMSVYHESGVAFEKFRDKICYRIHINENVVFTTVSKDSWKELGSSRVVCFSVPSSFLIVQKDYKTCISGNCGDPVATVMLARKMWNDYPYIRKIYKIDNFTLEAVRLLSQNELTLDYEYLEALKEETERKLKEIQTRIYSLSGVYGFNIDSAKEKADVLSRFVTLTEKTKTGKFKTDEEALMKLNHPIARLMVEYSETRVFLKSFVAKMCSYKGRVVRANYNTVNVPSGRLSSGGSSGNPYFIPQNLQNVPKEEERLFLHRHPVLGYVLDREEEGCVRLKDGTPIKVKTKTGLHRAFIPHDKDWFIMTSDYCSQEMALAANFSREPNLVEPLLAGKDIHNHVAKAMFGFEDPDHRTKVKVLNFACMYGAEGPTIANRLGVPVDEGKALFAKYKATMSKLYAWKTEVAKQAKKRGYSLTYFGRPIYLLKFLSSSERGKAAYAERLAINSTIQGCLPGMTFVPSQDGKTLKTFHACIAERVLFSKDEKKLERRGVPTYRGKDLCYYVKFKSGDFVVCSQNHKFLKYKSERALLSIADTKSIPVQLVPPQKKVKFWSALFKVMTGQCSTTSLGNLFSQTMKASVPANDVKIASALLRAYLLKDELKTTNFFAAHTFRSLVDLYGYNLVQVEHGKYRLKWRRKRGSKLEYTFEVGYDNVVSPSMISGYQTYPLSGFVHKNTGADLMRLFLIKFTMLNKTNEEWRNNTRMILPVHDEQNLEVHKDYLYKAWKYMKKVMEFKPDNFVIPIVVDSGVGTSWGNCLDFDCISLKNRIVPKDLDPEALPDDERTYLLDIIKECDVRDLPVRLKKYKNE